MVHVQSTWRQWALACLCGVLGGLSPAFAQKDAMGGGKAGAPALSLVESPSDAVVFHGLVNWDEAGLGSGTMAYPVVGGALSLVVGVLTHAALVEGDKSKQKTALQAAADKVVEPYQETLAKWSLNGLLKISLEQLQEPVVKSMVAKGAGDPSALVVESQPTFALTSDQRAVVLDYAVSVYPPGDHVHPAMKTVVRVISKALPAEDPKSIWLANEGARLKGEAVDLLKEALRISVEVAHASADESVGSPKQKTVRYMQGGEEHVERAQLVSESCERLVLKTLRGELMSVPAKVAPPSCAVAANNNLPG